MVRCTCSTDAEAAVTVTPQLQHEGAGQRRQQHRPAAARYPQQRGIHSPAGAPMTMPTRAVARLNRVRPTCKTKAAHVRITAQHSTAQHIVAQRSTAHHIIAQRSTAHRCTASTAQHSTARHSTAGRTFSPMPCWIVWQSSFRPCSRRPARGTRVAGHMRHGQPERYFWRPLPLDHTCMQARRYGTRAHRWWRWCRSSPRPGAAPPPGTGPACGSPAAHLRGIGARGPPHWQPGQQLQHWRATQTHPASPCPPQPHYALVSVQHATWR